MFSLVYKCVVALCNALFWIISIIAIIIAIIIV